MSTTFESNVESVMALIASMSFKEQCQIMEQTARALKKADGGKKQKQKREKKERDPDAPKREPSDWIKHTTHVRQFLADEHKGVVCTQVASMLKADGKMFPDEADVMDAYARWKENPPVKAEKADKKSKTPSVSGSVVDEASDAEGAEKKKQRKPRAKMTEEQKAASKAKREAKKAAESAESDAESVVAPVAAAPKTAAKAALKPMILPPMPVEEGAVEGETKEYKIGKKTKMYDCFPDTENEGCEYLYANDTGAFVGRYNTVTKTLTECDDPAA